MTNHTKKPPLADAILQELDSLESVDRWIRLRDAEAVIRTHFATLSADDLALAMANSGSKKNRTLEQAKELEWWGLLYEYAQAVMKKLRKE